MAEFSREKISKDQLTIATYAAAAVHALAREEARGRKPQHLLEAGLATWGQSRGRLRSPDLLELLLEDGAVTQPTAFELPGELGRPGRLSVEVVDAWIAALQGLALEADSLMGSNRSAAGAMRST